MECETMLWVFENSSKFHKSTQFYSGKLNVFLHSFNIMKGEMAFDDGGKMLYLIRRSADSSGQFRFY
jgi:hypothetical protein